MKLGEIERELLMMLQYEFPKSPWIFREVAEALDLSENEAVEKTRRLHEAGIVKRLGFYVNYKARGLKVALIAYSTGGSFEGIAEYYQRDPHATHVYLRDHPVYDVWVVTKKGSLEELLSHARKIAEEYNVGYVVLYSRRTYKLSVKYDLYNGVSRSGRYSLVPVDPPKAEDLGVPTEVLREFRSLEISRSPYRRAARKLGISEEEAAKLAWQLVDKGVLGDPGAALDGRLIGFHENAMVTMEPSADTNEEDLCRCAAMLPFTTHVVLRGSIPRDAWRQNCYFMAHAVNRSLIEELVSEAVTRCRPASYSVIRSIRDLKPGVAR
ncbi:MAG: Lrp/AsnC family transcriptional regulator [Desulfurococcales archaeon]|nr:Lrp/AsnC family transcriptional regulator [Desulfurococcales archaeon]